MVAFVKVLDEVGSSLKAEAPRSIASPHIGIIEPYPPVLGEKAVPTAHVVAAYRSVQREALPVKSAPPKTESFSEMMAAARHSAQSLRRLRRRLAWRLHPDRSAQQGAITLAEVNAAIDAALQKCLIANE